MASGTRERILTALRAVLARGGASAVTLESVAAAAGVSKGGLLYHFPNKEALYAGLLDDTIDEVTTTMADLTARRGPVRGYLDYSLPQSELEAAFFTGLIAAVRADDTVGPGADVKLVEIFRRWESALLASVTDPVLAQTVRLVGIGLYLGAVAGLPAPESEVLTEMVERLAAQADGPAAVKLAVRRREP